MSHCTIAVRPSSETRSPWPGSSGERRFFTEGNGCTARTVSPMTALNAGSSALSFWLWMTTNSVCGSALNPACFKIWSARCDWPTLASSFDSCFVPTCMPTANDAMTKASQPKTAVFQWLALQRPIRAAMLFERFRGDMALLRKDGGFVSPTLSPRPRPENVATMRPGVWNPEPWRVGSAPLGAGLWTDRHALFTPTAAFRDTVGVRPPEMSLRDAAPAD